MSAPNMAAEIGAIRRLALNALVIPTPALALARVRVKRKLRGLGWEVPPETPTCLLARMAEFETQKARAMRGPDREPEASIENLELRHYGSFRP